MKKVAFYIDNRSISSVNCSSITEGNPGIGGTEYLIILISTLLSQRDNDIEVTLFCTSNGTFPKELNSRTINDIKETINICSNENFDYLIIKHDANNIKSNYLDKSGTKIIIWCHTFVCYWELDYYNKNKNIEKIIYVGKEMRDLYRDHKSFYKSTYIYNCVNIDSAKDITNKHPYKDRSNIVTYMGSIVPYKGFHILAEAWPIVKAKVPDAELYIIGSGKLYDTNQTLGRHGIAEKSYEDYFMRFLKKGCDIPQDIHFCGISGSEKKDILVKTKVGVPNPSGITETFCISAVEMQMYGAKVTTINYPGFIDTIKNGVLYSHKRKLAKNIIRLLSSTSNNNYNDAIGYFQDNFSLQSVIVKWEALLNREELYPNEKISNITYRFKWLKEVCRFLKKNIPFFNIMPPIERILLFIERAIYGNITYMDSNFSLER